MKTGTGCDNVCTNTMTKLAQTDRQKKIDDEPLRKGELGVQILSMCWRTASKMTLLSSLFSGVPHF